MNLDALAWRAAWLLPAYLSRELCSLCLYRLTHEVALENHPLSETQRPTALCSSCSLEQRFRNTFDMSVLSISRLSVQRILVSLAISRRFWPHCQLETIQLARSTLEVDHNGRGQKKFDERHVMELLSQDG